MMSYSQMVSGEDKKSPRTEPVKATRVLPEGTKAGGLCTEQEAGQSPKSMQSPVYEFKLEDKWLIDPKHLFVGPKIGEGAHAKVYEGKYKDKNVAIKIIQPADAPEEMAKREARFAREVSLLSRVQHKNLVKFIGACKESVMVVVTELLLGGSLRKYMMNLRPKSLDLNLALTFALDIARVMECLHRNGIIHRDLKPDNLLLTEDKKKVKLADFGLAREETLTEMMTAETGTYRWMAPELYSTVTLRRGEKKHYDNKVDVYSFSIVLWELLTNRMPFEGMSHLQAAYAAAFKNARPSVENLPEELVFILQSCWAEDPNVRPGFTQIVRMLSAYLSTLPPPENTAPQQIVASRNNPGPMDSPATSSFEEKTQQGEGTNTKPQNKSQGLLLCISQCFMSRN
uniref:TSA: Wollemia nobilis Ref_Wollemi_Transcript_18873_2621 transcribed RNA sequence n=1 Tax=Wollemia nobilis TaxID=56998 RepID=A0A0C9QN92_9CONI